MTAFDYVEIGTCGGDFNTLTETSPLETKGVAVEPIQEYLDDLPNKPNLIKVQAAITHNKTMDSVKIFFISRADLIKYHLPGYLSGCNSIFDYHPLHLALNLKRFVQTREVPLKNVIELVEENDIGEIGQLKIDTEGHDTIILQGFYEIFKTRPAKLRAKKIMFESNSLTPKNKVKKTIELFKSLDYELTFSGEDTYLSLREYS